MAGAAGGSAVWGRARIFGAALAIVAAAVAGILVHVLNERAQVVDAATRDVERVADALRGDAEKTYRTAMAAIRAVDAQIARDPGTEALAAADATVSAMREAARAAFVVRLIDVEGVPIDWPRGAIPSSISLADRDYVAAFLRGGHEGWYVGAPGVSRVTGRRFAPIAMRASPNRHGVAVISAAIELDPLIALYEGVRPGEGGAVGLFRTDGTLLARAPFDEGMLGRRFSGPLFRSHAERPDGLFDAVVQTDGTRRITAYRSLPDLPVLVAAGFSVDEALSAWRGRISTYVAASFAIGGLILVFAVYADRAVRREARYVAALVESRDRAERANMAKSRFLASMSHELRTPLNAILGFSELIRDRMFGPDLPRYAAYAGDIHASAEHLLSLVEDVLDLARIETGRLDLRPEDVDLRAVADEAAAVVLPEAARRGADVAVHVRPALRVHADRRALRQILINLLSNAVRYGPEGAPVEVRADLRGDRVAVHVIDAGPGVPQAARDRMSRPLEADRDPLVASPGGVGLGLPIVAALARAHGGRVDFAERPAGGSRVTVLLPAAAEGGAAAA
jgi:two-component system cell cycle sensor histidine kinase PleC